MTTETETSDTSLDWRPIPNTAPTRRAQRPRLPAEAYWFLFERNRAQIAGFEYPQGISIDLAPEEIFNEVWRAESYCIEANQAFVQARTPSLLCEPYNQPFATLFPPREHSNMLVRGWIENNFNLQKIENIAPNGSGDFVMYQQSMVAVIKNRHIQQIWIETNELVDDGSALIMLRELESHYRRLIENRCVALVRIRPDGLILYMSPHVKDLLGYGLDEFREQPRIIRQLLHPDDVAKYASIVEIRKRRSTESIEMEYRLRHRDGSYHWVRERQVARVNLSGEIIYYESLIVDTHELRQLELELLHSQRMEIVGTLAGGIAHDFNNHLAAILGQISLTLRELDPSQRSYSRLAAAEQAALCCTEMTKQLLSLGARTDLTKTPITIRRLVQDTVDLLRHVIPASIEIALDLNPDLPCIEGNQTQLQQVFMNLGVNARDAMKNGGTMVFAASEISLKDSERHPKYPAARHGNYIEIQVEDSGHGIPASHLGHIFDPFFTTKPQGKGSGLGLSMVYSVVKSHDGHIHVASEIGRGSVFSLILPAIAMSDDLKDSSSAGLNEIPCGNETILVADDDEMVLSMVRSALQLHGYTVVTATDGLEAVTVFKEMQNSIQLALIDQSMPKLSGREVLNEIYANNPSMRVILTSGYGRSQIELPADGKYSRFIGKPYPLPELLKSVRELLDLK